MGEDEERMGRWQKKTQAQEKSWGRENEGENGLGTERKTTRKSNK